MKPLSPYHILKVTSGTPEEPYVVYRVGYLEEPGNSDSFVQVRTYAFLEEVDADTLCDLLNRTYDRGRADA